jgi:hypothetical protein
MDDAARVTYDLLFRQKWTAKRTVRLHGAVNMFHVGNHAHLFASIGSAAGRTVHSSGVIRQRYRGGGSDHCSGY